MQYQLAFGYFVGKKPNGWTNLLLVTICFLIPVVGPLVILGYRAECAERLLRDPDLRKHPDFSFDRFMPLLQRGLWPFLVSLIGSMVVIPVALAAMFGFPLLGNAVGQPVVGIVLGFLFYMLAIVVMTALMGPMVFYTELANRFDLGGAFRHTVSFWKLTAGPAVIAGLLFTPMAMALYLVGMLACFIGVYPAIAVGMMAAQHLAVQLHLEYLDRGGEPIVKTETDEERRRRRRGEEDGDDDHGYDVDDAPRDGR